MAGQEAIASVNGPMACTLADVELYSKVVIESEPWLRDPRCMPIPWRAVDLPKKLKIAVLWDDGLVRPTPPVIRALKETVEKLKAAGHDIIEWDPVDQKDGLILMGRMFVADGGQAIRNDLERAGEPWRPEMDLFRDAKELGTYDMWKLQLERTAYQNHYLDRWNKAGIDAILTPTVPFNTVTHGVFRHGKSTSPFMHSNKLYFMKLILF